MRHRARGVTATPKADGSGPVTEADLEIDRMLQSTLLSARPSYGWLSEESVVGTGREAATTAFIVDPIDGTRSYSEGGRDFCIALATVRSGRPETAVAHFPALDRTYVAQRGHGATLNGEAIAVGRRTVVDGASVLASRSQLATAHWPGGAPSLKLSYRGSLIGRICLVAEGRYDATFSFRPTWEWDIAAGALILQEAGGVMTDGQGREMAFNRSDPRHEGLIGAGPAMHSKLLQRRGIAGAVSSP